MKKIKNVLLILLLFALFVKCPPFGSYTLAKENFSYQVLTPQNAANNLNFTNSNSSTLDSGAAVLFIVDFSNSMNDKMGRISKLEVALDTLNSILPQIPHTVKTGLRVYGHKGGFTYLQGCMASKLLVPLGQNNVPAIQSALASTRAVGWTPITYSLKSAVSTDFVGISGKKHIILLTDGGENCDESPCTYAIELMKTRNDIMIDVIAFDLNDQDAINQLRCTALTTSGKFYTANSQEQLKDSLFNSLNVDRSVKGVIKTK